MSIVNDFKDAKTAIDFLFKTQKMTTSDRKTLVERLLSFIRRGDKLSEKDKKRALKEANKYMFICHYFSAQKWFEISGFSREESAIKVLKISKKDNIIPCLD